MDQELEGCGFESHRAYWRKKMENKSRYFGTGNIVKYKDSLYIVGNADNFKFDLNLLSWNHSNSSTGAGKDVM